MKATQMDSSMKDINEDLRGATSFSKYKPT